MALGRPSLALKLVAECGTDLTAWPSAKHFTSWLCFAPGNEISGGKAAVVEDAAIFEPGRSAAPLGRVTIGRSDTSLGAFSRRLSSRVGKRKAVTATARKIAVLFYDTLRFELTYRDLGAAAYDEGHRTRARQPSASCPVPRLPPRTSTKCAGSFLGRLRCSSRASPDEVCVHSLPGRVSRGDVPRGGLIARSIRCDRCAGCWLCISAGFTHGSKHPQTRVRLRMRVRRP